MRPLPLVYTLFTGRLDYSKGLILQKYLSSQFKNNSSFNEKYFTNVMILTEHNPVYTIGIRTKDYTEDDEIRLRKLGADFYKTNRGGLITFHGPGQLVVYPIIHLKQFQYPSIKWYVKQLEMTVIDLCKKFNIDANISKDTGIWVNNKKICAIGIHASRYVTTHGIGLNCNTDLKWFDHIVPCGLKGKGVTSITKEIRNYDHNEITLDNVIPKFLTSFRNQFKCDLENLSVNDRESIMKFVHDTNTNLDNQYQINNV